MQSGSFIVAIRCDPFNMKDPLCPVFQICNISSENALLPALLRLQMLHGHLVPAAESIPIVLAHICRNMRMVELIAVGRIRRTMIREILARPFDAVVKSLALILAELRRRL